MAGREPEPGEAQDGIYRRTWKDFWHGKGEFWVSTILALGAAAFGGLVIPAPQDRVWAALLGLVLGFVAGLALCLGWHFMRSPFRQRDDARRDAGRLEAELAARDRIDFQVNLIEPEYIGRQVRRNDGSVFDQETVLYIEVQHLNGPPPEFSAAFSNITGAVRASNGDPLDDYRHAVAWEDDYKAKRLQFGFHARERLLVARSFRHPTILWFVIPESQAWNQGSHGEGWPLVPLQDHSVTFELEVVNETECKSVTKLISIGFAGDGSVSRFAMQHLRSSVDQ